MCNHITNNNLLNKKLNSFQDVEDTSFFEQYIDGLSSQACGNAMYKVLGVKHKPLNNK